VRRITGTPRENPLDLCRLWFRSGDKFRQDEDGYFVYAGRSDDMLRVSGFYVSPAEVEAALVSHEAVLEAAVVGHKDDNSLIKPKAYVVLKQGSRRANPQGDHAAAHQGQARAL